MGRWLERWGWWKEFWSLGRDRIEGCPYSKDKLRHARLYRAATDPTIVAAIIGAVALLAATIITMPR
jgi:hypothetical protein